MGGGGVRVKCSDFREFGFKGSGHRVYLCLDGGADFRFVGLVGLLESGDVRSELLDFSGIGRGGGGSSVEVGEHVVNLCL